MAAAGPTAAEPPAAEATCRTQGGLQVTIVIIGTCVVCIPLALQHLMVVADGAQSTNAETTVRDAQSYFNLVATLSLAVFNLLAGLSITMRHCCQEACMKMLKIADSKFDTKPIFFIGCILGYAGLALQWAGSSYPAQLVATGLFGAQQALCATPMLLVLMYRFGKQRALAVGIYLACVYASELIGHYCSGLVMNTNTECVVKTYTGALVDLTNASQTATFLSRTASCNLDGQSKWHPLDCNCMDVHYAKETDLIPDQPASFYCECDGYRPTGPIIGAVFLAVAQVLGFTYQDKNLAKQRDHDLARKHSSEIETPRGKESEGFCSASCCAPNREHVVKARQLISTTPSVKRLSQRSSPAAEESLWKDEALCASSCRVMWHVLFMKPTLRACVLVLFTGGMLSGAMRSTIFALEHAGVALDAEISPLEERVVVIANLLGSLIFAVIMGKASDDNNRKIFVAGGLVIMVVAAGLGTSAVAYQTDTGFRRGELFVASIVSGIGSSTIYCAAIAAVHEEAKLKWRALAIGACRMAWELGRALGSALLDPIGRDNEMMFMLLIALFGFAINLMWLIVFKDERAGLGTGESTPDLKPGESEEDEDEEGEGDSERRP